MAQYKIAVIGGGSWGTTVASLISRNGNAKVILWARDSDVVDEINLEHRNSRYLGDAALYPALSATNHVLEAVEGADVVIMGMPSDNFRTVLSSFADNLAPGVPLISLTKGLESGTYLRMTEVCKAVAPDCSVGVLTGPNLAREIIAGQAAASVLALSDKEVSGWLRPLFNVGLFRAYSNSDIVGCELGGVFKNVVAIAVGMADGLGAGDNTRAALITRGLAEMTRFGVALGGRQETFAGLAGVGDMIATCTSAQSRNRHVGIELAEGRSIEDISRWHAYGCRGSQECIRCRRACASTGFKNAISDDVHKILIGESNIQKVYRSLLRNNAGAESEPG